VSSRQWGPVQPVPYLPYMGSTNLLRENQETRALTKVLLALAGGLLLIAVPGRAQTIDFEITTADNLYFSSGTFTADPLSGTFYQLTSVDGTLNGQPMALLPSGTYYGPSDNRVYTWAPFLSYGGIAFVAGGTDYNLYAYEGITLLCSDAPHTCGDDPLTTPGNYLATFTWSVEPPTPTPEPSALVLFGTGLVVIAGVAYRKLLG
jgi:hypothetical protein